jgi:hypothetical protein
LEEQIYSHTVAAEEGLESLGGARELGSCSALEAWRKLMVAIVLVMRPTSGYYR